MTRRTEHAHHRRRHALLWLFEWALFFGLWMLFVAKASLAELMVGVPAATLAAIVSHRVWGEHLVRFSAEWRSVAQGWRVAPLAVTGTAELLAVLARHLFTRRKAGSLVRAVRFAATERTAADETRRALAIAYATATPGFVVIDVSPGEGYLLFHQIAASPVPELLRALGARA